MGTETVSILLKYWAFNDVLGSGEFSATQRKEHSSFAKHWKKKWLPEFASRYIRMIASHQIRRANSKVMALAAA